MTGKDWGSVNAPARRMPGSDIIIGLRVAAEQTVADPQIRHRGTFGGTDRLDLVIDDERITTTPEHPFAVRNQGWVAAIFLKEGDIIQSSNGAWGTVLGTQVRHTPQPMYNLTVVEAHTFFVGDGQWLVHNQCYKPPFKHAWIKRSVFSTLKRDVGDATFKKFVAALNKGMVSPQNESGVKKLATPHKGYEYELKVLGATTGGRRLYGNIDENGILVFEYLGPHAER